jgi:LysR family transcriptional regulator, carnitine catabolism transcriptional activator
MSLSAQLLEAFVALEESRHFTQAAERCNLTQSAFSQMIRRLETAVGTRLFDRHTRSVRLTPEGAMFAPRARRILQEIHTALSEMRDHAEGRRGKLSLAIIPSLAASWLPAVLDEYARAFPGIAIEAYDTWPERGFQLLKEGRVDLVIGPEPGNVGECDVRSLFREPFLLACSVRHPIAARRVLQLRDFRGVEMMYPIHIDNTRVICGKAAHKLRPFLRTAGVKDTGVSVEHLATIIGLISAGMGVCLVPLMSRSQVTSPAVVLVPIARSVMQREIYLSQRTKESLSLAAGSFVSVVDRHIPKL